MRSTCLCWASTAPRTLISASSRRLSVSDLGWSKLYHTKVYGSVRDYTLMITELEFLKSLWGQGTEEE
jgi:hypothetical protein